MSTRNETCLSACRNVAWVVMAALALTMAEPPLALAGSLTLDSRAVSQAAASGDVTDFSSARRRHHYHRRGGDAAALAFRGWPLEQSARSPNNNDARIVITTVAAITDMARAITVTADLIITAAGHTTVAATIAIIATIRRSFPNNESAGWVEPVEPAIGPAPMAKPTTVGIRG